MTLRAKVVGLIRGAATALEAERGRINDLNVYPVPDGDTGTNLFLTVQAMLDELEGAPAESAHDLAAAVTRGSLMGARGNSGVILSQIVRGACETLGSGETVDSGAVALALREASAAAYHAVRQPVEGTMLTVIRRMSEAADAAPSPAALSALLAAVLEAGAVAVEETIDQLDVLRRSGVVDAGGYGLLVIVRGMAAALLGDLPAFADVRTVADEDETAPLGPAHHIPGIPDDGDEYSRFRYCTSFLLVGERLDRDELERFITSQGDSALVVGEPTMLKVHVHTDHPGTVLSFAEAQGVLGEIEVADMREQTRDRDRRLRLRQGTAVVAVVAGPGNHALFHELGVGAIVDGGQSMNPSAAQLLEAIETLDAGHIVILPNNKNVVLTAEQAAAMCERDVSVVPTVSLPAGLSAMVVFDPQLDAAANALAMDEAAARVRTGEITVAVRDSHVDGVAVREGDVIGLVDGRLAASGGDLGAVFAELLARLCAADVEVITVLTALNGSGLTVADLERLADAACPTAEVSFHEGGQPHYPILAGAE